MAVRLADVVRELGSVASGESNLQPGQRSDKVLQLIADFLIKALARDEARGKVGVLLVPSGSNHMVFVYPKHLARGNMVPIDQNSFAGRCLLRKETLLENHMPDEPHLEFYERIRDEKGTISSIQKMITAPLIDSGGSVVGVIQVSRAGNSPIEAGPDFTPGDAENLTKACRIFAPYIVRTWTREARR